MRMALMLLIVPVLLVVGAFALIAGAVAVGNLISRPKPPPGTALPSISPAPPHAAFPAAAALAAPAPVVTPPAPSDPPSDAPPSAERG